MLSGVELAEAVSPDELCRKLCEIEPTVTTQNVGEWDVVPIRTFHAIPDEPYWTYTVEDRRYQISVIPHEERVRRGYVS